MDIYERLARCELWENTIILSAPPARPLSIFL